MKNTKKTNYYLLTTLYITGFIISGSISAMCLTTMGQSKSSKILLVGITIIFEFGKGISFFEAISGRHSKRVAKLWFLTWITLTSFSIFASMAFTLNESGKTKNKTYENSQNYETKLNEEKRIKKLISTKEEQLASVSSETESTIELMKKELNNLPEYYTSKRKTLLDEINDYSDKQQSKIDEYTKEIENLNDEFKSASNKTLDTNYKENQTEGYISILTAIANFLNGFGLYSNGEWSYEDLELVFYFLLNLTLEIIVCLLYYLKKYNQINANTKLETIQHNDENEKISIVSNDDEKNHLQINDRVKVYKFPKHKLSLISCNDYIKSKQSNENTESKSKSKIKFNNNESNNFNTEITKNKIFNDNDLKEYLNFVYKNKNGNISPGQKKISENTSLSYNMIREIRNYLESKRIINVDSKTTYLAIKNMDEALSKLTLKKV